MLENEMQFRMDLEKLKAQVAEYERRLEDQEDVGDPPLAVEAGSGIEVQSVAGAWRVSATETEKTTTDPACMARVVSGNALSGYTVDLYADGLEEDSTGTGTLFFPEVAAYASQDLPAGSVLLAHPALLKAVEGLSE